MSAPTTDYFEKLGQRFGRAQDELLAVDDARALARARLFSGMPRSSSRAPRRRALVPALALATALLLFLGTWLTRATPLSFAIGERPGQTGQLLSASGAVAVPVRFSDGSVLELTPHAQSRVLSVEHNGARVELQRGALRASVVHRADTAWAVVAGPFQVAVTGTKFVTEWDPQARELKVIVEEGSVVVSGGSLHQPERVSGGKVLRVSLAGAEQVAASGTAPRQVGAALSVSSEHSARAPAAAGKAAPADVEPFRAVFDSGSPTDLITLSKELRQRGDLRGAARALQALRARFPVDPRSGLAAHTLTELALARRDCAEARRWLEAYLVQAPAGTAQQLSQQVQACGGRR
jgi:hypothetical protein